MTKIAASELILNEDGSVYHLKVRDEHIADNVILVGDPDRVELVSSFFDSIEHKIQNREFVTHTGTYKGTRFTVMSSGIGTDNIDIVLNEIDAAVNIDLETKTEKKEKRKLNLVRIGTSGALHADIEIDSFLISEKAMGFDGLLHFYSNSEINDLGIVNDFKSHANWKSEFADPYVVSASPSLLKKLSSNATKGITATASGFYAPQGRKLRLSPKMEAFPETLASFKYGDLKITNFEMETSGLYALSNALGHEACTICAIIANRASKKFSSDHSLPIRALIEYVLNNLTI